MTGHDELLEAVIALIEEGEFEQAATRAEELQALEIPDGWHLKSVALLHDGEDAAAFEVLEEGIAKFPENLGLLLEKASSLMQLERFQEADGILEAAKDKTETQKGEIEMMQARSEFMQGKVDEALNRLQDIDDRTYILDAIHLQLELLEAVGRTDVILEIAESDMENFPTPADDDEFETMAGILAKIANAHWEEKDDVVGAKELLKLAFHYFRNHSDAMWLWREMEPTFADDAKAFAIEVNGTFLEREELGDVTGRNYHTYYQVLAGSLEEAVSLIKDYEIDAIDKDALKVLSVESEPAEDDEAVGVYWAGDMVVMNEDEVSSNGVDH